jgi:hypothetical protein
MSEELINFSDLPCCPEISKDPCCEKIEVNYRLRYDLGRAPVEIIISAALERCPGPLALGDVVYSTTLLPGEKVRLFTMNRNSRFTYDRATDVTYRHEQTSEESYFAASFQRSMSSLVQSERTESEVEREGESTKKTGASGILGTLVNGPSVSVAGTYSAEESAEFMRDISRHASASSSSAVLATRAANATQVGEVSTRTRIEGESEASFEAATRSIENKNQCHAVTYLAYQLVKQQKLRFSVTSITRRVVDPAASGVATARPEPATSDIATLPAGVLATDTKRIEVEASGRTAAAAERAGVVGQFADRAASVLGLRTANFSAVRAPQTVLRPIPAQTRAQALKQVDDELVRTGVLDAETRQVSKAFGAQLAFEITTCLPTQAIVVKGCIDKCSVCEDSREKSIALDLERKALENKMLERKIEILDKAQEYRCCPKDEEELEPESA